MFILYISVVIATPPQLQVTYIGLTVAIALSISFSGLQGAIISLVGVIVTLIVSELYLRSHLLEEKSQPTGASAGIPRSTQ